MTITTENTVNIDDARETFKEFLATKGLRVTNQRLAIFDAAFDSTEHFTAEDLLALARVLDDSVSRATVYRSLPILTESGLIREVDVGHDNKYYLANHRTHTFQAQVVCEDCSHIFEVDAPFMEWYGKNVCERLKMTPITQRLQVSAHCEVYRQGGQCERSGKAHPAHRMATA